MIDAVKIMPSRTKILLARLACKDLDMDSFLLECARWTMEILDEYTFKPYPSKPSAVLAYEQISGSVVSDNPDVVGYYEETRKAVMENKSLREWLEKCRMIFIKANEFVLADRVSEKLKEEMAMNGF